VCSPRDAAGLPRLRLCTFLERSVYITGADNRQALSRRNAFRGAASIANAQRLIFSFPSIALRR